MDIRLLSRKTEVQKNLTADENWKLDAKNKADQAIKKLRLSKLYEGAVDKHVKKQVDRTIFDYNNLVNLIANGAQPMITYVYKTLTESRSDTVKLLRAVK